MRGPTSLNLRDKSLQVALTHACVKATCKDLSLKFKDVGPLIRFSTTGRLNAPSIDDLCFVLGKKRVVERISRFLELYQ